MHAYPSRQRRFLVTTSTLFEGKYVRHMQHMATMFASFIWRYVMQTTAAVWQPKSISPPLNSRRSSLPTSSSANEPLPPACSVPAAVAVLHHSDHLCAEVAQSCYWCFQHQPTLLCVLLVLPVLPALCAPPQAPIAATGHPPRQQGGTQQPEQARQHAVRSGINPTMHS